MDLLRFGLSCLFAGLILVCLFGLVQSVRQNWNYQGKRSRVRDIIDALILIVPACILLWMIIREDALRIMITLSISGLAIALPFAIYEVRTNRIRKRNTLELINRNATLGIGLTD